MSDEQRSFYGLEKLWTGQAPPAREPDRLEGMGIGEFEEDEMDEDDGYGELDEDEDSEDEELEDAAVDEPSAVPKIDDSEKTHGHAA